MKRLALIMASTFLLAASTAKAGELDAEYGGKTPTTALTAKATIAAPSTELDAESPDQSCCWRKRLFGYGCFGRGYGYGGFGYGGFGYGGYGGYGGFGGGYGGFGGGYGGLGYGGGFGYGGYGW